MPDHATVPGGSDRDNYQAAFELLKEQRYEPPGTGNWPGAREPGEECTGL